MSDFIALDWERQHLIGLDAHSAKGRVHIRQCFRLAWPEECAADAARAGKWLKQELHQLGVKARQVLVSLPREEAVVRQLDVPDVPDHELPELVRLQAETKSASSLDRLVLDFLPLPRSAEAAGRQVLVVTIPREKLERLRGVIDAAGLELVSVGISPVGAAELVARTDRTQAASGETTLVVARTGKRVEISLMRQNQLLFTHSTQLHGDDDETDSRAALAEIRRTLGAQARVDAAMSVARARIIGTEDENSTLRRLLAEHLECQVDAIDPLSDAPITVESIDTSHRHSAYAGPLGMLLAGQGPLVPAVDFLHPREPVVRRDLRKLKLGLAAAGVALGLAALYGNTLWRVRGLDRQIAEMNDEVDRLAKSVENGKPQVAAALVVDDWNRHTVDPLARLVDLDGPLPGSQRLYLKSYSVLPATGTGTPRIEGVGFAKERHDVQSLADDLSARGYAVQPRTIARETDDSEYPWRADLRFSVPIQRPAISQPTGPRTVRVGGR
ncbi:MAG: pilus assembly protein PilM [Planctomycetales bacterium]